jgi:hypothetical protein
MSFTQRFIDQTEIKQYVGVIWRERSGLLRSRPRFFEPAGCEIDISERVMRSRIRPLQCERVLGRF